MKLQIRPLTYTWIRYLCTKHKERQFIDWKKIVVKAGNGGDGNSHFRRKKRQPRAGPDGGDGGHGGSIILMADSSLKELAHVRKHNKAENGEGGRQNDCHGYNSSHLFIKTGLSVIILKTVFARTKLVSFTAIINLVMQSLLVMRLITAAKETRTKSVIPEQILSSPSHVPLGTIATHNEQIIADMSREGHQTVIAQGGRGGLGNAHFKSATNQAPEVHTTGTPGEEKVLELELKTIADVGLVGFPNAGKSTLLRAISQAKPAVAAYPFTTLNPYVGMVEYGDYHQIAVADIPGLITGAHQNKGLGHSFLRHIERCRCLLYVLDISQVDPKAQFLSLQHELELYKEGLSNRPSAIVANKIDNVKDREHMQEMVEDLILPVIPVSALFGQGIGTLKTRIRHLFEKSLEIFPL